MFAKCVGYVGLTALAVTLGCKSKNPAPTPGDTTSASVTAPSAAIEDADIPARDAAGSVQLAFAKHAPADNAGGTSVYLSRDLLTFDGDDVPLEGFSSMDKLLSLTISGATAPSGLAFAPAVGAAKRHLAARSSSEVTLYADRTTPYLALGQLLESLLLAGMETLHLVAHVEDAQNRTFDFETRDSSTEGAGDGDASLASIFPTFVRIQSTAHTCEAKPIRDPWEMKDLAACAASVKRALGPSHDRLVVVPGMQEPLSDFVSMLDAMVPSFTKLVLVVDGDILRGRGAKEELARVEAAKRKADVGKAGW